MKFTAILNGNDWQNPGLLVDPAIYAYSSYYDTATYVRNMTNLVQNDFVPSEPGLKGAGYYGDTHDNGEDDVWHRASTNSSPYVTFDLGRIWNLSVTRIWNLNQAGYTENGAKDVRISVSANCSTFTVGNQHFGRRDGNDERAGAGFFDAGDGHPVCETGAAGRLRGAGMDWALSDFNNNTS